MHKHTCTKSHTQSQGHTTAHKLMSMWPPQTHGRVPTPTPRHLSFGCVRTRLYTGVGTRGGRVCVPSGRGSVGSSPREVAAGPPRTEVHPDLSCVRTSEPRAKSRRRPKTSWLTGLPSSAPPSRWAGRAGPAPLLPLDLSLGRRRQPLRSPHVLSARGDGPRARARGGRGGPSGRATEGGREGGGRRNRDGGGS